MVSSSGSKVDGELIEVLISLRAERILLWEKSIVSLHQFMAGEADELSSKASRLWHGLALKIRKHDPIGIG